MGLPEKIKASDETSLLIVWKPLSLAVPPATPTPKKGNCSDAAGMLTSLETGRGNVNSPKFCISDWYCCRGYDGCCHALPLLGLLLPFHCRCCCCNLLSLLLHFTVAQHHCKGSHKTARTLLASRCGVNAKKNTHPIALLFVPCILWCTLLSYFYSLLSLIFFMRRQGRERNKRNNFSMLFHVNAKTLLTRFCYSSKLAFSDAHFYHTPTHYSL